MQSGDIETNRSPKKHYGLKFFHWDFNELAAHDFNKLPLIEAWTATNNFDIVCLSETSTDASMSNDYNSINVGY